jgi:hypothetical protein
MKLFPELTRVRKLGHEDEHVAAGS